MEEKTNCVATNCDITVVQYREKKNVTRMFVNKGHPNVTGQGASFNLRQKFSFFFVFGLSVLVRSSYFF